MPATGDRNTKPYPFTDTKGRKYRWSDKKQSHVYEDGERVPSHRKAPQPAPRRESSSSQPRDFGSARGADARQFQSSSARDADGERTQPSGSVPIPGNSASRGNIESLEQRFEATSLGSSPRTYFQPQPPEFAALRTERRPSVSQYASIRRESEGSTSGDRRRSGTAGGQTSSSGGTHPLLCDHMIFPKALAASLTSTAANEFAIGAVGSKGHLSNWSDPSHDRSCAGSRIPRWSLFFLRRRLWSLETLSREHITCSQKTCCGKPRREG